MYRTRHPTMPLHNSVVEFRAPNGGMSRLVAEQGALTVRVEVGCEAPLPAERWSSTKKDPRIDVDAVHKDNRDAERFRRRLAGEQ